MNLDFEKENTTTGEEAKEADQPIKTDMMKQSLKLDVERILNTDFGAEKANQSHRNQLYR